MQMQMPVVTAKQLRQLVAQDFVFNTLDTCVTAEGQCCKCQGRTGVVLSVLAHLQIGPCPLQPVVAMVTQHQACLGDGSYR